MLFFQLFVVWSAGGSETTPHGINAALLVQVIYIRRAGDAPDGRHGKPTANAPGGLFRRLQPGIFPGFPFRLPIVVCNHNQLGFREQPPRRIATDRRFPALKATNAA